LADYDPAATLARLEFVGFGNNLQAQVLRGGGFARAFSVFNVSNAGFVDSFFGAKLKEILDDPVGISVIAEHRLPAEGIEIGALPPEATFTESGDILIKYIHGFFDSPVRVVRIPGTVSGMMPGEVRDISLGTTVHST